ncbi:MBL fold metallo-hydrolase [Paenibacillus sp. MZ04-78.2]|uniref:MBL fold metallo-hydrolase n=1 Tax=Paenibacillus sp. MZ04-78.2 TaxID=2962034 RepID=UPI0020B7ACDA|nr:MBL fold metallo-hydrolase [Paenibacillus sp. MZ04-78.2]MCP3773363.1 MBL fold metallo-hydrolase [Paenibacillus sp. MZ04-78.2]
MEIQLIRNATHYIEYGGKKLLIDPMLSPSGAMPPFPNTPNSFPNPTVNLKVSKAHLLQADAVLLTHSHPDHFDAVAAALLPKDIVFFCQPEDAGMIRDQGFRDVRPVENGVEWDSVSIVRTSGQHGTGEIGKLMGPVSGFVLNAPGEPVLYIAGDTIWCLEVEQALAQHKPDVVLLFGGSAQFLQGGPITMNEADVAKVASTVPDAQVIVAHMEALNHCLLQREDLRAYVAGLGLSERVRVPEDGESIRFHQ